MIRASCGGAHLTVRATPGTASTGRTSYARRRPRWCTRWRGDCGRQGGWNGSKARRDTRRSRDRGLCPGVRAGAVWAGAAGAAIPRQGGSWVVTYHGEESSDGRAGERRRRRLREETGGMAPRRRGAAGTCRGTGGYPAGKRTSRRWIRGRYRTHGAANTRRAAAGTAAGRTRGCWRWRPRRSRSRGSGSREAQLQAAMEFAVIRRGSRWHEPSPAAEAAWRRTADGAGASAAGDRGGSAVRSWRRYGREYRMERRSDF